MSLRFACLGSGSRGNSWVVACGETRVLLDAGFSGRETCRRLALLGIAPERLGAILLTHEHGDHVCGVGILARRFKLPVFASPGTLHAIRGLGPFPALRPVLPGETVVIGDLALRPFSVPHDATQPCAYAFTDGVRRLGIVTDLGCPAPDVADALHRSHALVLECNHDAELLMTGSYPWSLKQRIRADTGHLSNTQSAALLSMLKHAALRTVAAAHLSAENNAPSLARAALAGVLGCAASEIDVADQYVGLSWRSV